MKEESQNYGFRWRENDAAEQGNKIPCFYMQQVLLSSSSNND